MSDKPIYSSMSDIALFLDEPALWFFKNFLRHRDPGTPKMWRGRAVEAAVNYHLLADWPLGKCLQWASEEYWQFAEGEITDEIQKFHDQAVKMTPIAIEAMGNYGKPLALQQRIERRHPTGVHVVGYADMVYEDAVRDLKTKDRMPSRPKPADLRQLTWYSDALGRPAEFVHVTVREHRIMTLDEAAMAIARSEIDWALQTILKVRAEEEHWREIAREYYPPRDFAGYRWTDATRQLAREVYG